MYSVDVIFLINLFLLSISSILMRANIARIIVSLFVILLLYCIYVLHYTKIYMMFDFFLFGWITTVTYSFILITFISFIFTIIFFNEYIYHYTFFILIIYFSAYTILFTDNLLIFLLAYELLLIPSFYILYRFAKTLRCVEAAHIMLFWTQFGAIILIFINVYIIIKYNVYNFSDLTGLPLTEFERYLIFISLIISFGVKMPIWPFHLWLPKAHVEAPTNFSIFLSGVLVKLAFFAFIKFICLFQFIISFWILFIWLTIGIFDVSMRIFYQIDLKKIIAFTTVIEMHWLLLTALQSNTFAYISAILMIVSHAIISSLFFLLIDSISRRLNTRYVTEITSLWLFAPNLTTIILLTNILFLGFPCTSLFWAEVFLFYYLFELNPLLYGFLLMILFLIIPITLFKFWIQIMYGNFMHNAFFIKFIKGIYDINLFEIILYVFLLLHLIAIGICPTLLLC